MVKILCIYIKYILSEAAHRQAICSFLKYLKQNKNITLNCGTGTRYSVLEVIKAFEKKIKRKFKITYKVTNTKETHTICSNTALIKKVLKTNFEKDTINHLIKEYL